MQRRGLIRSLPGLNPGREWKWGDLTLRYRSAADLSKLTNKFSHLSKIDRTLSPRGRRI